MYFHEFSSLILGNDLSWNCAANIKHHHPLRGQQNAQTANAYFVFTWNLDRLDRNGRLFLPEIPREARVHDARAGPEQ